MTQPVVKHSFKNEYDREIKVSVESSTDKDGPRPGPRVKIKVEGPDSVATNIVTPREAKAIAGAINAFFRN